jgi:hypothetical protein
MDQYLADAWLGGDLPLDPLGDTLRPRLVMYMLRRRPWMRT